MPMLDLRDLRVGYGGTSVLDGLSLTVERGELVCLLGPSGCGKTTALRAVGGYLLPDSGQVLIDGEEMGSRFMDLTLDTCQYPFWGTSLKEKKFN